MLKSSLAPWQRDAWRQIAGPAETYPAALLIAGPRGIGKEELSRFVAKGLLCEDPHPSFEPCGRCVACQWCDQGAHPDLKRVESEALARDETAIENNDDRRKRADKKVARQISVAQVRELSGFLSLTPHRRGSKVVMVIPAEDLSPSAANALLKTLEEPPPKTVFLLVTHQPHRVLPTVRSRCRILPMRAPPQEQGMAWLAERGVSAPAVLDAPEV
jgi:DNA polymerase-3 subunit delta'